MILPGLSVYRWAQAPLESAAVRLVLGVVSLGAAPFSRLCICEVRLANLARLTGLKPKVLPHIGRQSAAAISWGFIMAVSSPWNLGFWLAVVGSQSIGGGGFQQSLLIAVAVVLGALTWTLVLCIAVKSGARIFSRPNGRF